MTRGKLTLVEMELSRTRALSFGTVEVIIVLVGDLSAGVQMSLEIISSRHTAVYAGSLLSTSTSGRHTYCYLLSLLGCDLKGLLLSTIFSLFFL